MKGKVECRVTAVLVLVSTSHGEADSSSFSTDIVMVLEQGASGSERASKRSGNLKVNSRAGLVGPS